ncbi:hypothetical protein AQUCO_00500065v1 [Aquilegia coerulea]|uniref:NB-ARC domain-containing protein n=1 Tax=Aquilegia coerulea TaxID=218851 RepID=A0A2G5EQ56_AQUCA|nr:hypothetical protein AQUCO_00500065v1 [Aquilegia coerulea]
MSVEIVQFLMTKFTTALQETGKDQNQIPLRKYFEEIKVDLEKKIHSSTHIPARDILIDCLYKLNDAFIECQMMSQRKCCLSTYYSPKELFSLVKIKRGLSKIEDCLRKVPDASTASSSCDGLVRRQTYEHSYETADTSECYGFKDRMEEIIKLLQRESEDGLNRIGIVGMGGSGKSTLAQLVLNSAEVQKEFSPRIWVPLSQTIDQDSDIKEYVLEHLLLELGEEEGPYEQQTTDTSVHSLLISLNKQLSGKKYLIVFDDVWYVNTWYEQLGSCQVQIDELDDQLDYGLPKGCGGGIIVTSRIEQVVKKMVGEENLHGLLAPVLNSDDCWSIFKATLKKNGTHADHPTIAKMKHEIVEKCHGLPLAAKTLGDIISTKLDQQELLGCVLDCGPIDLSKSRLPPNPPTSPTNPDSP